MESGFHISNYTVGNQVKYATCTIFGNALTWWNFHIKTVGHNAAYGMTWKTLMKILTNKYYPRGEIKKLEIEMWNLKFKGTNVVSYTQRFQELALMCGKMFLEESYQVEKSGCPELKNKNHGNQAGSTKARGMVYALGGGEIDQELDNMEADINA
nr:reverse transcriptase domain-containing protein [Tanacetum cinerariifolium]